MPLLFLWLFLSPQWVSADTSDTVELDPIRLQLKWLHQFQFAGYYAAIEQGYYRDAGLDVTLLEHPLNRSPIEVLLSGDAEYVVVGSDVLVSRSEGAPLVALAAITQHDPLALLVTADSGIRTPADLKGKRVMLDYGAHDASILAMLKKAGLEKGDYELQQTSYNPLDLVDNNTDAFNAYITDQGFLLDEKGVENHYLHPSRYGIDFYSDILTTTEGEISEHPQRVANFREASIKGWTYAMANTDEVIELILQKYNTQGRSRAHLEYEAVQMREMVQPLLVQLGYMHEERWNHIRDTFQGLGFLKQDIDIKTILYQQEPDKDALLRKYLLPALASIVLLGIAILLVTVWNRKLKQQVSTRTQDLADANTRIELILQSMNEGLVVTDINKKIIRINRKLERLTGLTPDECTGINIEELFAESNEHSILDTQRTLIGPDDQLIPVQVNGALLQNEKSNDELSGAVLIIHDLRDRVRADQQEQYASFQAGVSDMSAAVLHNIGNVITGMSGQVIKLDHNFSTLNKLTSTLSKYLESTSDEELNDLSSCNSRLEKQQYILQASNKTLKKLNSNIDEKSSLNRLNQGIIHVGEIIAIQQSASRPIIHATRFTYSTMVADTVNLIEDRFDKYGVTLKVETAEELKTLFLPRNPLMQMLLNLLKNSLEAIIEEMKFNNSLSGEISLSASANDDGQLNITLNDNGCGYNPTDIDEIFKSGHTTKSHGSGYGLHSVSSFVTSLDGLISAQSAGPHQGMEMQIVLPIEVKQELTENSA